MMTVAKWLCIALAAWLVGLAINLTLPDPTLDWIMAIRVGKLEAARNAEERGDERILLAGGSGTHFGVDAAYVEEAVCVPTANIGFHAGLGMTTLLEIATREAGDGDLVVFFPEHGTLDPARPPDMAAHFGMRVGDPTIGAIDLESAANQLWKAGVPTLMGVIAKAAVVVTGFEGAYSRKVDANGSPVELPSDPFPTRVPDRMGAEAVDVLGATRKRLQAKGADILIVPAWIYVGEVYDRSEPIARDNLETLAEAAPLITPGEEKYGLQTERAYFGDTQYHLSPEGRTRRTEELAAALKELPRFQDACEG